MRILFRLGLMVLFLSSLSIKVFADNPTAAAQLSNMDLQDMLNINVPAFMATSISAKKQESTLTAPSSVTVWTDKDIETMGYYDISDLANVTPGYSSYPIYGESVLETRGQKAGSFNDDKTIEFIDGIPVNFARDYKADTQEELPLYFAKSVEFMRGPSSALYGTGAFYGAVSITPKDLDTNGTMVESRMTMGGDNFDRQIMTNYVHRNDTGDTKFDFSAYGQNASATELGPNGDNQANRNYDNSDNYFLYTSHDFLQGNLAGLTTGLIVMNKNDGLGEFWDGPGSSDNKDDNIEWNEVIPYVKYKRELNENNTFDGYVKMNYSMEKGYYGDPGSISRYTAHTDDGEDMMEITSKLPWDITSIVGVDNDAREDYLSSDGSFEKQGVGVVMMNSAYFQLRKDFPVLKNLNVTVGGRYDEEDVPDDKLRNERVSPRVAFVEQVTDNWFLKYFHEEALRAPGGKEIGLNEETLGTEGSHIDGLPVLHPETMKTDEVDLMFANKSESFVSSVGYFWDQTANSLDGASGTDNVGNPYNYFQNDPGVIRTEGYEWDMRYAVTKKFQIMANTSFANPRNANGTSMADVPSQMANLILSYDWMPIRMRSAFILRWVKDYRVDNDQGPNGGYTVCDLNFNFPIFKHISLGLQFKNLLDKRFYYPQSDQEDVPLSGRTVLGTVEIHF